MGDQWISVRSPMRYPVPALVYGLPLVVAAAVRLWGIRWGLPDETHLFSYHPDEYHSLRGAWSLALGDPNPHFHNYGSLYLYMVAVVCLWHDAVLGGADLVTAVMKGATAHQEMAAWVLDARLVVVVCALVTVALAVALGRRLAGPWGGLTAGLVMALLPLHVLHSHYATVDVPQAMFIAGCLYFAIRVVEQPSWRNTLLAGVMAGLAASVKYNGMVALAALLVTCAVGHRPFRSACLSVAGMVAAAGLAFAVTSPFVLLSWQEAWQDISFELRHMRLGESPAREAYPNGWLFHAHVSLLFMALALLAAQGERRRKLAPLVAFGVVWFGMIGAAGVRYARYEMPLEVLSAVCGGVALVWLLHRPWGRIWRAAWLLAAAAWLAVLGTAVAYHDGIMARRNVRDVMLEEVVRRVPVSQSVATIWEPWFNLAPLDYCNGGAVLRKSPLFARFQRPVREVVTCGVDPEALAAAMPAAVLVSDFELDPSFARVSQAHRRVMDLLWRSGEYELAARLERPAGWGEPKGAWRASDNRYPCPNLYLFLSRERGG